MRSGVLRTVTDALGLKVAAYIAGEKSTATVRYWLAGGDCADLTARKFEATAACIAAFGDVPPEDIQRWFGGIDDRLDDTKCPAHLLRDASVATIESWCQALCAAARRVKAYES